MSSSQLIKNRGASQKTAKATQGRGVLCSPASPPFFWGGSASPPRGPRSRREDGGALLAGPRLRRGVLHHRHVLGTGVASRTEPEPEPGGRDLPHVFGAYLGSKLETNAGRWISPGVKGDTGRPHLKDVLSQENSTSNGVLFGGGILSADLTFRLRGLKREPMDSNPRSPKKAHFCHN